MQHTNRRPVSPMIPPEPFTSRHHTKGVTLIEVMIVISILAILLSIALPSYQRFIISNRLTGQINELVADLSMARNEAGTRSRTVRLCIAASSTACSTSGTAWEGGRILWVDTNNNGTLDSGTEILKYVPALDGNATLSLSGFSSNSSIAFLPYGGLSPTAGGPGTFTLCATGDTRGRQVTIPFTGRALAKRIDSCP